MTADLFRKGNRLLLRSEIPVNVKNSRPILHALAGPLLFASVFFLPWIERFRLSIFLWIALGVVILLDRRIPLRFVAVLRQPLLWLFSVYFLFQLAAFFEFPANNYLAIEEKISLVLLPLLLFVLVLHSRAWWRIAALGFICGVIAAALWCLLNASAAYLHSRNPEVFFYNGLASGLTLNAVYFSCYILTAIAYLVPEALQMRTGLLGRACRVAALFLFVCLLLLGSKLLIIAGSLLLLGMIFRVTKDRVKRGLTLLLVAAAGITLLLTDNPVKRRYKDIDLHSYVAVFSRNDFSQYPFDGLSLRLALWRMGYEIVGENRQWVSGMHGGRYHVFLDKKMKHYHLPDANRIGRHGEYREFNMISQYMESYLQFGLAGLALLAGILFYVMRTAVIRRDAILAFTGLLFILVFFTESVLEVQSGILLFTLLVSGEWAYARTSGTGSPELAAQPLEKIFDLQPGSVYRVT